MLVAINEIKVDRDRIREDFGDIEDLANSIATKGLLQPIVLRKGPNGEFRLVAGGRRLAAHMHNRATHIEARLIEDMDEISAKEAELEENVRRKDLNWVEEVRAVRALYDLKVDKFGPFPGERYTLDQAEKDVGKVKSQISVDLNLAKALEKYPDLAEEPTKQAAWKRYKRNEETAIRAEVARRTRDNVEKHAEKVVEQPQQARTQSATEKPKEAVRQPIKKITWKGKGVLFLGDSRDVLRLYPEKSVDCIVTDPPYALGMFKEGDTTSGSRLAQNAGHMYDDDPAEMMNILDQVFFHAARVLKDDGHAYVFFHMTKYEEFFLMLRKHFGTCEETPLVWIKNTPGIGDPNRSWVYAYEPCFFINRGRSLVKPQAFNYLKYDTVPPGKKIHPTQKPDQLLRHIISASCVADEVVLDPFAGSGSTLVAASQVGCKFIGIEREEKFHRITTDRIAEELALVQDSMDGANATDNSSSGRE